MIKKRKICQIFLVILLSGCATSTINTDPYALRTMVNVAENSINDQEIYQDDMQFCSFEAAYNDVSNKGGLAAGSIGAAAGAAAATLETSIKGIIYEHTAQSAAAQRLTREIASVLEKTGKGAGAAFQQEVATVLRSIERGARETSQATGGGKCAYLELMGRLLQHTLASEEALPKTDDSQEKEKPRLIMP